jgi:hypothetical protein
VVSAPAQDEDLLGFGSSSTPTTNLFADTKPYQPTNITTPDFAARWGEMTNSKQFSLEKSPLQTPDLYKDALQSRLGFQVIQIIQNEVISGANNAEILVHARVHPTGNVEFTIRCKDSANLASLEEHLRSLATAGQQTNPAPATSVNDLLDLF